MRRIKPLSLLLASALSALLLALPAQAVSNQEQVWVYLRGQGLSQAAAAGIMGNIEAESNYRPNNLENGANRKADISDEDFTALVDSGIIGRDEFAQSETYGLYSGGMYGYGLAQWTWYTYKEDLYDFAKDRGAGIGDLEMQLDFLLYSAGQKPKLADYKDASDVVAATVQFHNVYENSNSTAAMISDRVQRALDVFAKYGDATVEFPRPEKYAAGRFRDVTAADWFASAVADAYELGLMDGVSGTEFDAMGSVTLAQAITMAARIHSIYATGAESFPSSGGSRWYQVYLDYAYDHDLIDGKMYNSNVEGKATRAQFAEIFSRSMPSDGLIAINQIADNAIPDVSLTDSFGPDVYRLYRAGVLTGSDARGTFHPGDSITRAEAAAIVARMGDSTARRSVSL